MQIDEDLAALERLAERWKGNTRDSYGAAVVDGYSRIVAARIIAQAIRESGVVTLAQIEQDPGG